MKLSSTRLFSRRGPLALIGLFLLGSAVVRIAADSGEAFARELAPETVNIQTLPKTDVDPTVPIGGKALEAVLNELSVRETEIKEKEAWIAERLVHLEQTESRIAIQLAALEQAEKELRQTLTMAETAASEDVARLTAVFQKMKPKDAAKLFAEMDPNFAAGFLAKMKPEVAAALMAGLEPETAYTFSVILAGRNARAPKE